jgi:hypothetical protein
MHLDGLRNNTKNFIKNDWSLCRISEKRRNGAVERSAV